VLNEKWVLAGSACGQTGSGGCNHHQKRSLTINQGKSMYQKSSQKKHEWNHGGSHLFCIGLVILFCFCLGGCTGLVDWYFQRSLDPTQGELTLSGLKEPVTVRRDAYGIPFIEAKNREDLAFAIGYVNANDRLVQMTGFKLLSQGRLSEMAGPVVLNLDMYMRAMNLKQAAENLAKNTSPENLALLARYAEGVNAYIDRYPNRRLPPALFLAGYTPEKWTPADSLSIFAFINFALSFNLHEEVATLSIAQKIGAEKTAWLLPIYPNEPLPFTEAAKLHGIELQGATKSLSGLTDLHRLLRTFGLGGLAASNNWAINKERTKAKASILANDQHLVLSMPAMYSLMHLRCPGIDIAGINLSGLPVTVAGFNGRIAWGMTMVMADNQDIFLEQLKSIEGRLHYLYKGQWRPVVERQEIFRVKGKPPVTLTMRETVHGPLLNDILNKEPLHILQARKLDLPYGIALSQNNSAAEDKSVDAFFGLSTAGSAEEASVLTKRIRAIPLNMVFADRDNIGWQVTGNYPVRARGRGLMPSPGWTGKFDWTGFLDAGMLPAAKNPPAGFIGTANHRTIAKDYPHVLSSSWYWPERAERIAQMAQLTDQHTRQTSIDMQLDVYSPFVPKLQEIMFQNTLAGQVNKEISRWKYEGRIRKAQTALTMLKNFDGNMKVDSPGAALVSAFLDQVMKNTFLDELGPADSDTWQAFVVLNNEGYSATSDHLLLRGDESPFWDDIRTPPKETKAQILANSLVDAVDFLEKTLGAGEQNWTWGALHSYTWETDTYALAPQMSFIERAVLGVLKPYFNRGPYPAPGDHLTLNVSNYMMGKDFATWNIPTMRLIVDFSQEEPMIAVNSSGQSDNPSSPHYEDGIKAWREGRYISFPFKEAAVKTQYTDVLTLKP
jgi:acyl-homoserine-lactone acylase